MRTLGYPKLISMESFRLPNFDLVADILYWLLKCYEPNTDILNETSTENDRVTFIKQIATFLAQKANIKLSTRKIYAADGNAVRELLKVVSVLYQAQRLENQEEEYSSAVDLNGKLGSLKNCRLLASEITEKGAILYDLLGKELELRDQRTLVITQPFDLNEMGQAVKKAIKEIRDQTNSIESSLQLLSADELNLTGKIDKKRQELERAEKRLKSLQVVRPAYMDEYERIEQDLTLVYDSYMEKYRNLMYLEQQLEDHFKQEQDKFEETEITLKQMQNRLRDEEIQLLRGDKELKEMGEIFGKKRPNAASKRSSMDSIDDDESDESEQVIGFDEDLGEGNEDDEDKTESESDDNDF